MSIVKVDPSQVQNEHGCFDMYYDKQLGVLYSTINGLSRWLDCNTKTISSIAKKSDLGKNAEILTPGGLQGVTLFTSEEVVIMLDKLVANHRVKKQTRDNAQARMKLLATIGNDLGGMLLIAPEELAKKAIARTTTIEQLADVQEYSETHLAYLREFHGLKEELTSRGADWIHHATVNKHNNMLVGVPTGGRPNMSDDEKDTMTLLQLSEKMVLKKTSTANPWQAVNKCKAVGNDFIAFIAGYDAPKLA